MILSATDTFIKFLSQQLANDPPVHWVRATTSDETSSVLQMNTLNVEVLGWHVDGALREADVSLDLIGSDERTVIRWVGCVQDALDVGFVREVDYTTSPVTTLTGCISWNRDDLSFDVMRSDKAFLHYNALMTLRHVR